MSHPLSIFLLQLIIIIVASRIFAYLFQKIGQPAVMGEIIAGIALGPSLLGTLYPAYTAFIFPASSLGNLQMLSQVGLILFMFVIGMELDLNIIKAKAKAATLISITSIVIPYALGVALAFGMHKTYAPAHVPFHAFALFMGIAMSITAFPVLARIIRERKIGDTRHGAIAITSAAVDDVTGWCILAIVIAIVKAQDMSSVFYSIAGAVAYVCVMLFIIRPLLKNIATQAGNGIIRQSSIAIIFIILLLSAWSCEVIGIHALFGAFMTGVVMPLEWDFRKIIINKIDDVALLLLLPIFFVLTGLRTQIGLLNTGTLWAVCALITSLAIAGKLGGSALAAKITGESNYTSLAIGALMNTRGLMELIVLNIGYDLGILTAEVFTMMVMMALITTLMTNPILNLLNRIYAKQY